MKWNNLVEGFSKFSTLFWLDVQVELKKKKMSKCDEALLT